MVNDYRSDAAQPRGSTDRVTLGSRRQKEDGAAAPSFAGSAVVGPPAIPQRSVVDDGGTASDVDEFGIDHELILRLRLFVGKNFGGLQISGHGELRAWRGRGDFGGRSGSTACGPAEINVA